MVLERWLTGETGLLSLLFFEFRITGNPTFLSLGLSLSFTVGGLLEFETTSLSTVFGFSAIVAGIFVDVTGGANCAGATGCELIFAVVGPTLLSADEFPGIN